MSESIRDLTSDELTLFADVVARLRVHDGASDIRAAIIDDVVRLVRADFAASFVWNRQSRRFDHGVLHNISPELIRTYEAYHQFHDPHTFLLRARRSATLVEEVNPYPELRRTEFYNDFLRKGGLHHGVNIFLFDGDDDLGDFRLWRASRSPDFGPRETALLNVLAPHLRRALMAQGQRGAGLTAREREVVFLVARGCRDRDICGILGISFSTVRTHINNAMEKTGCANRAELATSLMRDLAASGSG